MGTPIKVMLVDDEMPVRDAYGRWLENDGRAVVIGEAEDRQEAVEKLKELVAMPGTLPDVIALDMGLPGAPGGPIERTGGVDLIPTLKGISPKSRILMFTQGTEEDPIIEAFSKGADGYIWKNETGDAIATAIQRVYEGKLVATISVAEKILGKFRSLHDREYVVLPRKKRHKALSELLYRTMKLYCYDGLSAKEIAEREHVSLDGINSRIKKAKEVLGASSRREAFRIMSELGEDTT
jgi:DNA-binding NarL/FixJ family response regulator